MAGRIGSIIASAASGHAEKRISSGALLYVGPWVMWVLAAPLAMTWWFMTSRGPAAAFILGAATLAGAGYLLMHTWGAFADRGDVRVQVHAVVTVGLAVAWLSSAAMFGLFHKPDVDVWPELWRIFEYALKSFTLPIWGSWFVLMVFTSIVWNALRVARPLKAEGSGDRAPADELTKILDGSTIKVDAVVGTDERPVIKARHLGVPGKHTGGDLAGKASNLESLHGLRPGAIRSVPSTSKASDAEVTIMIKDPHADSTAWPGPSAPGTSIADSPIPCGPHTDGESGAIWMVGDEETGRPNQHVACAGMNGAGKSGGGKIVWADFLTRRDTTVRGADISGKIWQTFGPLLPYMTHLAGLNGTDDDAKQQNVLDARGMLLAEADEARERQYRWGKEGINQWGPQCFERWGDTQDLIVVEEAPDLLEMIADEIVPMARLFRSAGKKLWFTAQRFSYSQVPTDLRAQLAAVICFGMNDSRDANMILPEDVAEILNKGSVMNHPGGWQNNTPGKAIVAASGIPVERRSDPVRFFWGKNAVLEAALAAHGRRLWTPEQIEGLKDGVIPDGLVVRRGGRTSASERTKLVHVQSADVHDDADIRTRVYRDPELDDVHGDPDEEICTPEDVRGQSFDSDPADELLRPERELTTDEFRTVVQKHLRSLLAQGRTDCSPTDILNMEPPTGRTRHHIRNELIRLAREAGATEVSTVPPHEPGGSSERGVYRLVPPREVHGA